MPKQYFKQLVSSDLNEVDRICDEFARSFNAEKTSIEHYVNSASDQIKDALFEELLAYELELKGIAEKEEYVVRFPERVEQVHSVFDRVFDEKSNLKNRQFLSPDSDIENDFAPDSEIPLSIGRFRVQAVAGVGGFGVVYKAYDNRLKRDVAIKVPRRLSKDSPQTSENYLAEARTVGGLNHPNIVPVYELGSDDTYSVFIVSKFVNGFSLAAPRDPEIFGDPIVVAELIARIADALQYAHQQGVVHRDIKPGNILIDEDGQPHLTDFGLAMRDKDVGRGAGLTGTISYMSPEQAQGESHRIDGRSDVFSLGLCFTRCLLAAALFSDVTGRNS